jgi:uncharacterized protein YjbI with pentapeptide repeats
MEYKGMWNATSGAPSVSPNAGDVYRVNVAGTFENIGYEIGDYVIYSGSVWEKSDNSDNELRNDLASVLNGQGASLIGVEAGTFTATDLQGVVVELDGAIDAEVTARVAADLAEVTARNAAIATAILAEVTARDAAIDAAILEEVTARDAAISVVASATQVLVQEEASARVAADLAEVTARNAAISTAIASEVTARNAAIDAAILVEVTARDAAISAAVAAEATLRDAADLAEVTARNAAISSAIASEVTARDAAIDAAILEEVTARNAAIDTAIAEVAPSAELITLSADQVSAKSFDLISPPNSGASIVLFPLGGLPQSFGDDFTLSGSTISWTGLGMDSLGLVAGDKIRVIYFG